ncbi:MAG: thrombospondin type 3 repeat-containing protein [Saprospiraceae bacterium]|nr:thrombospondin type 3 repeat-containing protein [Saprospiraceae bacterium]
MKKLLVCMAVVLCLLQTVSLVAQDDSAPLNGISAKVLFIDYNTPNSIDGFKPTNGIELAYLRNINQNFAVGIPLKVGLASIAGSVDKTVIFSLDAIGQFQIGNSESIVRPYLFAGIGMVFEQFEENNAQIPVGLGLYVRAGGSSFFTLQGEYRKSLEDQRDNIQLGIGWHFKLKPQPRVDGPLDTDADGLPDAQDYCPNEAGTMLANGCPDTDDDGVPNGEDDCPTIKGPADNRGCPSNNPAPVTPSQPSAPAVADRDGDGINDSLDQCPDQPGTIALKGCPPSAPAQPTPTAPVVAAPQTQVPPSQQTQVPPASNTIDSDGDGLVDSRDQCPTMAGPILLMGCPDSDNDGITDKDDRCPNTPGEALHSGCPDTDKDGIADDKDACPNQAGASSANGCPDADGDGTADREDDCPNEKGNASNRGCPVYDADNDGIADKDDLCPNQRGPSSTKGCPDTDGDDIPDKNDLCPTEAGVAGASGCPDGDNDGTPNHLDKCPDEKGTNEGCPDISREDKEVLAFAAKNVQFETGKATLKAQSYASLEKVAQIMTKYPRYNLNVDGHTDDTGDATANRVLSEERAASCYQYLLARGVDVSRMNYKGYGESKPIAANNSVEGRERNRRVEFNMYVR